MTERITKLLENLHEALTEKFLEEVRGPEDGLTLDGNDYRPAPAVLNAARQFLKDNDITIGDLAKKGGDDDKMRALLETLEDPEEIEAHKLGARH